jgi:mannose-6-phosphate isomerase-like protein (cupin superfamily)
LPALDRDPRHTLFDVRDPRAARPESAPGPSHPNGEEVIYIISGLGRVLVSGEVEPVAPGSCVLFPQGAVHMLHNTGGEEMKVACFFAPPTNLENYRMYEDVGWSTR